jgi:hypothetical protein
MKDILKLLCVTRLIIHSTGNEFINYLESNQIPYPLEEWYLEMVNSINPVILNLIEDNVGLTKEIQKISDKKLRNWFKNHIKNTRENLIIQIKQNLEMMEYIHLHEPEYFNQAFEECVGFIDQRLLTYIMDYYLITRIFKTVSGGPSFDRVIIYAGNAHSKFYCEILEELGFELINHIDNEPTKCVDIRSFKPFFNIGLHSPKRRKKPSRFQHDNIEDKLFM